MFSAVRCHQRTQRTFIETVQANMQNNNQTKFFSLHVINKWNKQPQEVMYVPTINAFKNRLDRHWRDTSVFS